MHNEKMFKQDGYRIDDGWKTEPNRGLSELMPKRLRTRRDTKTRRIFTHYTPIIGVPKPFASMLKKLWCCEMTKGQTGGKALFLITVHALRLKSDWIRVKSVRVKSVWSATKTITKLAATRENIESRVFFRRGA